MHLVIQDFIGLLKTEKIVVNAVLVLRKYFTPEWLNAEVYTKSVKLQITLEAALGEIVFPSNPRKTLKRIHLKRMMVIMHFYV